MKKNILLSFAFIATLFLCSCTPPKADVTITVDKEATITSIIIADGNVKVDEFKGLSIAKGQSYSFSLPKGYYSLYVAIDFDPAITPEYKKEGYSPIKGKGDYLFRSIRCTSGDYIQINLSDFGTQWYVLF